MSCFAVLPKTTSVLSFFLLNCFCIGFSDTEVFICFKIAEKWSKIFGNADKNFPFNENAWTGRRFRYLPSVLVSAGRMAAASRLPFPGGNVGCIDERRCGGFRNFPKSAVKIFVAVPGNRTTPAKGFGSRGQYRQQFHRR